MVRPLLLSALIITLLTACSSGKTALKQGQFDLAVQRAAHRLQQGPGLSKRGHATAPWVLQQAFVRAYEQHQLTIRRLSSPATTDAFRWEAVHAEYEKLQQLTDNARRVHADRGLAGPERRMGGTAKDCDTCTNQPGLDWLAAYPASYQDRQRETRELAAADRYNVAEQAFALREENRLAAKDAYLNYRKAAEWVPDYRQARGKAADALPFAILRVVVEPLSPTREIDANDNQELQRLILQEIGRNPAPSPFVQLYPPDEIAGDGYPIHQVVQMQVTDYDSYDERTSSSCTTVYSDKEYKVGEKKINDSTKVDIMEKVKGTLTTHRREITAELTLRMKATDVRSGALLWEDPIGESQSWVTEWQTFSGDERALNGSSLKTASLFPPSRWSMYRDMRDELVGDVARRLRQKYASD